MANRRRSRKSAPVLDISPPRSMRRAGAFTGILVALFTAALGYLTYTLVTDSPFYMSKTGKTTTGKILDRTGDVLFDGSHAYGNYPAGQFADVGNFIGDDSGQMSNTVASRNLGLISNYSFLYGSSGNPVRLNTTLSHAANKAVNQAFAGKNGAAIACNYKTGELLVCLSRPCFDIAQGYDNLDALPSGSLLCKAFLPTVPGSTQKVSTLIAAYEHCGIQQINETQYSCEGSWVGAGGGRINCHNAAGHGLQTLSQAFANSCNPYFAQLVQSDMLPLSAIASAYRKMGYGINGEEADSYEMNGIVIAAASTELKDKTAFDTQWGALGQGKTLVSPYQLMLFEEAIANGTGAAPLPYVLQSRTDGAGNTKSLVSARSTGQMFSAEAAQAVRSVMTENSTNNYSWQLSGRQCGVKSGTAQVKIDGRDAENSFLAGFCLEENCPVAFCVMIEDRVSADVTAAQIVNVMLNALAGQI